MNVFLLDDEYDCLKSFSRIIKRMGHECFSYSQPKEAIQDFNRVNPELVIVDYNMPEMNGLEVVDELKYKNKKVIVILLSGSLKFNTGLLKTNNQIFAYLQKPVNMEKFVSTINQIYNKIDDNVLEGRIL